MVAVGIVSVTMERFRKVRPYGDLARKSWVRGWISIQLTVDKESGRSAFAPQPVTEAKRGRCRTSLAAVSRYVFFASDQLRLA